MLLYKKHIETFNKGANDLKTHIGLSHINWWMGYVTGN